MRIEKPGLNHTAATQNAYKTQNARELDDKAKRVQDDNASKDSIEISVAAQKLYQEKVTGVNARTDAGTGLTAEKLERALYSAELTEGPEQSEKIAGKVMEKLDEESKVRADKVALAKKRVNENFYNSPDVTEKIANGLMKEMNIA